MTLLIDAPIVATMEEAGGTATLEDLARAKATTAPCRIKDCEAKAICALGGKNMCHPHAMLFLCALSPSEYAYLKANRWITHPANLFECPANLPRIDLNSPEPVTL